jgi:hypothetical protein
MSLHINKFIELVKACEARGQRDLHMPLRDARDLHADITALLLTLEDLRQKPSKETPPASIEISGGGFR